MKENIFRKLPYLISFFLSNFTRLPEKSTGVCFVTHKSTKGWILDTNCKRLSAPMSVKTTVHYSSMFRNLPKTYGYFFMHYKYLARAMKYNPVLWKSKVVVMFTHPAWSRKYPEEHIVDLLNKVDNVVCMNTSAADDLRRAGVKNEKLRVFHLASDPEMFTSHQRRSKGPFTVGLSMGYYERKNPDLLFDIVKKMPDVRFILLGVGWEKFSSFEEMSLLENFCYYGNLEYDRYPSMYHEMDVFLSTSLLEGGPVPLLEAMLSNVVPVVSNTGFSGDIVKHGTNGFLFDVNENADVVCGLIRHAFEMKENVRKYVTNYNWNTYAAEIEKLIYQDQQF